MSSARPATFFLPAIQRALAPDLLREPWRSQVCAGAHPHTGHCYVASEALYHQLGGKAAGYTPMFIRHEGQPHWFLRGPDGQVLDPTAAQFRTPVPYERAVAKGFLTTAPSKRAQELRRRAGLDGVRARVVPHRRFDPLAECFTFYVVRDDLWARVTGEARGHYWCLADFERALGRRVNYTDLKPTIFGAPLVAVRWPQRLREYVERIIAERPGDPRWGPRVRTDVREMLQRAGMGARGGGLGAVELGATFERATGGAWVGYRVARYDPKRRRAISGADSRLSHALTPGTVVEFPRVGIWLSHDPAYVEDHYANHDHNVLVRFAFDPRDVTRGSLEDRETEIAVSRAVVLSSRVLD